MRGTHVLIFFDHVSGDSCCPVDPPPARGRGTRPRRFLLPSTTPGSRLNARSSTLLSNRVPWTCSESSSASNGYGRSRLPLRRSIRRATSPNCSSRVPTPDVRCDGHEPIAGIIVDMECDGIALRGGDDQAIAVCTSRRRRAPGVTPAQALSGPPQSCPPPRPGTANAIGAMLTLPI